jgi:hypothetical protein
MKKVINYILIIFVLIILLVQWAIFVSETLEKREPVKERVEVIKPTPSYLTLEKI